MNGIRGCTPLLFIEAGWGFGAQQTCIWLSDHLVQQHTTCSFGLLWRSWSLPLIVCGYICKQEERVASTEAAAIVKQSSKNKCLLSVQRLRQTRNYLWNVMRSFYCRLWVDTPTITLVLLVDGRSVVHMPDLKCPPAQGAERVTFFSVAASRGYQFYDELITLAQWRCIR